MTKHNGLFDETISRLEKVGGYDLVERWQAFLDDLPYDIRDGLQDRRSFLAKDCHYDGVWETARLVQEARE